ncbi:hypothetical protein U758_07935 [Streptococcus mitis 27/7]|uniref:DUF1642 domain-containing protein n=1 Tax=Streptococcus mitis TaxID=28037 RepID=UPI0003D3B1C4|nr:DUF1642 domain-containing protein [Streptococcus mitis]ETD97658.1 hypothetical protein U758_07935 [Streptococcus mitis 27/7]
MSKQELIERIEGLKNLFGNKAEFVEIDAVIELISKLDEPQPVKVPQCVADWYEENKDDFETSLFQCIYDIYKYSKDEELNEFENWIIDENTKPFQTLVNMHQFGYEVEKEKRYLVKIKATKHYFDKDGNGRVYFSLAYKSCFTKKQLENANLGWVFDCPGIEIEEVE